jgi:hypothetical protein
LGSSHARHGTHAVASHALVGSISAAYEIRRQGEGTRHSHQLASDGEEMRFSSWADARHALEHIVLPQDMDALRRIIAGRSTAATMSDKQVMSRVAHDLVHHRLRLLKKRPHPETPPTTAAPAPPPPQPATRSATVGAKTPVKQCFPVRLDMVPEKVARPRWWPAEKRKSYGGELMQITLPGFPPPVTSLDSGGNATVDDIPPGTANIAFADFYNDVEDTFAKGCKFSP